MVTELKCGGLVNNVNFSAETCRQNYIKQLKDSRAQRFLLLLVSMAVKRNNVLLNLITGCLYWLTTCFGQLHDHHQVYKS